MNIAAKIEQHEKVLSELIKAAQELQGKLQQATTMIQQRRGAIAALKEILDADEESSEPQAD